MQNPPLSVKRVKSYFVNVGAIHESPAKSGMKKRTHGAKRKVVLLFNASGAPIPPEAVRRRPLRTRTEEGLKHSLFPAGRTVKIQFMPGLLREKAV